MELTDKEVVITNDPDITLSDITNDNYFAINFEFEGEIEENDVFIITEEKYFNDEKKPRNVFYMQILITSVKDNMARGINIDITKNPTGKIKKGDKLYKQIFSGYDR